ncbi:MAG: hypothetical protein GXP05_12375 [Alphaproteobacteria bacterium]|nr:hypothetical protein [Alphaproteobacteria bacterium]
MAITRRKSWAARHFCGRLLHGRDRAKNAREKHLDHTISLMIVGGIILMTRLAIGVRLSQEIEALVGLMQLGLGAHVLYRLNPPRAPAEQDQHRSSVGNRCDHDLDWRGGFV